MGGKPVKLTWTREDDLHNDYFHAVSAQHLEAGLDAQGKVVAWLHRSVGADDRLDLRARPEDLAPFELGMGLINVPFQIPNVRIENPEATAHTRIGWLRSVNNIPHAFAAQSFIAEMARRSGQGPSRLPARADRAGPAHRSAQDQRPWNHGESPERYPIDTGRLRKVIETVTHEGGLGTQAAEGAGPRARRALQLRQLHGGGGRGRGGAEGELTIPRVDIAVDCGPQVNPDRVRSQIEGACVMGLSQATLGEITFKNGRAAAGQLPLSTRSCA